MSDELEKDLPEGNEPEEVVEEKPELPPEPADRNETIDVPVREQKKRNRFKEFEERTARAEKAAEEARREAQEARALHQQRLAHPQDQSRQQQVHPAVQKLRDVDDATRRLHREYEAVASRPGFTEQQREEYEMRALQLQTARIAAVQEATRQPVNEQDTYRRWKWQEFQNKHIDVFGDEKAINWAWGEYLKQVKGEGKPDTEEFAEELLDMARVKFGKKPRRARAPDAATRARLSGVSAQGGGGGDVDNVGAVRMGKRERQMAEALYDNLPPREAWQKWANGPGKRAALKSAGRK